MSTAAIVLAAGASRRLGRPKQLVVWQGKRLLDHVVARVADWPVDEVLVVLGAGADHIEHECALGTATVVLNPHWNNGLSTSVRAGLSACAADRAFLVMGDQPEIDPHVPRRLLESEGPVVVPVYRGVRSNPALVDRAVWPDLMGLTGDRGAATMFAAHPDWVTEVPFDIDPPFDIDTDDDVERQSRRRSSS